MSLLTEFKYNASTLNNADFQDVTGRLAALLEWMEAQSEIKGILDELRGSGSGSRLLKGASYRMPPMAKTNDEIAAVGLAIMDECKKPEAELWRLAYDFGIRARNAGNAVAPHAEEVLRRYIEPFLNFVIRKLPDEPLIVPNAAQQAVPVAIQESLQHFRQDYPDPRKVCFVMMQFGKTTAHEEIERSIKEALGKYGMTAILARDKEYHEELYPNIQTYMHGCGFGVAVFERIEKENFNPNVSLEVGYMLGLKKQVMLLKDQTLAALQADLVGRLYKPFDPLHPAETIAPQLEQWMEDKGFI